MKRISLLLAIYCLSGFLFANPVDVQTAKSIATGFLSQYSHTRTSRSQAANLELAYTETHPQTQENQFYVFNRNNQQGFVIVSGDDRTLPVLGYSENGSFNSQDLPDNFAFWLDSYREALKRLDEGNQHATNFFLPGPKNAVDNLAEEIKPLLGNISYNQNAPYNNLCPNITTSRKCATGCAATSMAQVMRYYKYPEKGIGSHSYTSMTRKFNLSADFGNTTYDWDNMLETYIPNNYTQEEAQAVATLLFHCGVSMEMDYNDASGAMDINMIHAFVEYFNYDGSTIRLRDRDFYDSPSWLAIIKKELNEGRPIIYNGQSVGGGHSFVCDGYNKDGLFHINWGWGGQSDGYFALDILDPGTQGIGGGEGGFNYGQSIITGIQPLQEGATNATQSDLYGLISVFDKESVSGTEKANLDMVFANFGSGTFSGNLALYLENDNDIRQIDLGTTSIKHGEIGGVSTSISSSDFPAGTYKAYLSYKTSGSNKWEKAILPNFLPQYFIVNTKDGKSTFTDDAPQSEPEITDFKLVDTWYEGKQGLFEFTLTNHGSELNQAIALVMISGRQYSILNIQGVYMKDGETREFSMPSLPDVKAGTYQVMAVIYNTILGMLPLSDPIVVTIEKKPSAIEQTTTATFSLRTDASGQLHVVSDEAIQTVRLMDISGNILASVKAGLANEVKLPTETLPAGTYLIQAATEKETKVLKFIKH